MWAVVVIVLTSLTSPEATVIRESSYPTEEACKAAVAKNVPARLDAKHKEAVEQGFRRYVCVRAPGEVKPVAKPDAQKGK